MASPKQLETPDEFFNEITGNTSCREIFLIPPETEDSFRKKLETGLESDKKGVLKALLVKLLGRGCKSTDDEEFFGFNITPEEEIKEIKELLEEPDYNRISVGSGDEEFEGSGVLTYHEDEEFGGFEGPMIEEIIKLLESETSLLSFKLKYGRKNDFIVFLKKKKDLNYLKMVKNYIKSGKISFDDETYSQPFKETPKVIPELKSYLEPVNNMFDSLIKEIINLLKTGTYKSYFRSNSILNKCKKKNNKKFNSFEKFNNDYILKPNSELYTLLKKKSSYLSVFKEYLESGCKKSPKKFEVSLNGVPANVEGVDVETLFVDCFQQVIETGLTNEDNGYIKEIIKIKPTLLDQQISIHLNNFKNLTKSKYVIKDILVFLQEGEKDVLYNLELKCRGKIYNKYSEIIKQLLNNPNDLVPGPPPHIPPPPYHKHTKYCGGARKLSKKRSRQTSNRKLLQTHKRSRHKRSTQTSNRKLLQKQSTHKRSRHKRRNKTSTQKRSTQKRSTQKRSRKATRKNRKYSLRKN